MLVNLHNWRMEFIRHKIKTMRRDLVSKVMSEMGRKGGKAAKGKGVKARMAALTPQERKELATKAARARWAKAKKKRKPSAK